MSSYITLIIANKLVITVYNIILDTCCYRIFFFYYGRINYSAHYHKLNLMFIFKIITNNWWEINCFYIILKDSLQHDLVHCDLQPDGDVFFSSSGDVRYSNLKSAVRGGRRHSISSFGNYSTRRPLSDCMAKAPRAGDLKGNF